MPKGTSFSPARAKYQMERKTYTIDAAGKPLGRLATQIAVLLRGKNLPNFVPNQDLGGIVLVKNIDKIKFTGKKFYNKTYFRHSGYLGNIKSITLKELFLKNPQKVLRKAVLGMLPRNKLKAKQIKRLKFE